MVYWSEPKYSHTLILQTFLPSLFKNKDVFNMALYKYDENDEHQKITVISKHLLIMHDTEVVVR